MKYEKLDQLSIRDHPELNERWVQERIAQDPSILGVGDVILKDKERIQPRAGRLDLLFQEVEGNRRYEVEIQLGKTDESHIVRTIEYWDYERKRYPQYDHTGRYRCRGYHQSPFERNQLVQRYDSANGDSDEGCATRRNRIFGFHNCSGSIASRTPSRGDRHGR